MNRMGADWVRQMLADEAEVEILVGRFEAAKSTYREAWKAALDNEDRRSMYTVERP